MYTHMECMYNSIIQQYMYILQGLHMFVQMAGIDRLRAASARIFRCHSQISLGSTVPGQTPPLPWSKKNMCTNMHLSSSIQFAVG